MADLEPGAFALVMATGIVSIAALAEGWTPVAWLLFGINLVAYPALWLLTLVRLVRWPRRLLADVADHRRRPGLFTLVAATSIVGAQVLLLANQPTPALVLDGLAFALWLAITYLFLFGLVVRTSRTPIEQAVTGGWLLATVASQSVAVLAALVGPHLADPSPVLLLGLIMWLVGSMEYVLFVGPVMYRLVYLGLTPEAWTPLFWINSGALSITTLAGAELSLTGSSFAFLDDIRPFVKAVTLLAWAGATWWIPLLVLVGWWRHVARHVPLVYTPEYWGLVFPLGMYTVGSLRLVDATGLEPLQAIPHVTIYAALLAWSLTFIGLVRRLAYVRRSR